MILTTRFAKGSTLLLCLLGVFAVTSAAHADPLPRPKNWMPTAGEMRLAQAAKAMPSNKPVTRTMIEAREVVATKHDQVTRGQEAARDKAVEAFSGAQKTVGNPDAHDTRKAEHLRVAADAFVNAARVDRKASNVFRQLGYPSDARRALASAKEGYDIAGGLRGQASKVEPYEPFKVRDEAMAHNMPIAAAKFAAKADKIKQVP